mgnify:CR=1 FL=1
MNKLITLNLTLLSILLSLLVSNLMWGTKISVAGLVERQASVLMPITNYSEYDSCHYPVKGGCLTASGTIASETTIACPRHWPLGTKVLIEDKEYTCEDRYNSNLSDRIDVWAGYGVDGYEKAKNFGIKNMIIVIK